MVYVSYSERSGATARGRKAPIQNRKPSMPHMAICRSFSLATQAQTMHQYEDASNQPARTNAANSLLSIADGA